jgi:molybdate transport system substrate-binding protein
MRRGKLSRLLWCLAALLTGPYSAKAADLPLVTVFAAASTTAAIEEIGQDFTSRGRGIVRPIFANSATLARQIEQGAPVDVFLSADHIWMDYLEGKGMVEPGSRADLLSNRMVLMAPADTKAEVALTVGFPLARLLGDGRLAMGNPESVPAGKYAKAALMSLGVWGEVENRLILTSTVLETLAFLERGEAPLGIGFASDAAMSRKVSILGTFPESSHPPAIYPVALVKGAARPAAREFLDYLKSPAAKAVFARHGFQVR